MKIKKQKRFASLLLRNVFGLLVIFALLGFSVTNVFSQTDWIKYTGNPILDLGLSGSWDSYAADMGTVLFDGSTYHLWYCGSDGSVYGIGHATSPDGIIWSKDPQNPVLVIGLPGSWDGVSVYMPCVLLNGSTFHMYYDGFDGLNERTGHATSQDGSSWIKDPLNPVVDVGSSGSWDDTQVFPLAGSVIFDGNSYHMWYGGCNSLYKFRVGYATSPDGGVWSKDTLNNPVMLQGSPGEWDSFGVIPGTVLFDGASYCIWYSGCRTDNRWRIGYATSTDGIAWTKDTINNPVLDYGPNGSWDYFSSWNASVLFDSTEHSYKMWYTGGQIYQGQMGYATDIIGGVDDHNLSELTQSILIFPNYPNPFSGTTTIEFELPKTADVEIAAFNQLGQQVGMASLPECQKGRHQYTWNASHLPDGVYFVRMKAVQVSVIRKVVKMIK